ncbi:hypothetical protein PFICI_06222 [Pestalotiopsis fici W106-1]|uniref:Uncharacterized protein n=1 Tax=Pestalotiopsis fici (strain W106-1 / CGMCC3.15140) TaxID=1229662 RepID=W3X5A4_PESFW|nr:uncharacterized protein PFICI_06222 [Pestalotiopsis fici W106-1]ETS81220.1 hypothetical protein PFICI_06222 [Pestalotiopsis fici W106-1]
MAATVPLGDGTLIEINTNHQDSRAKRASPPAPIDAHGVPQLHTEGEKDQKHRDARRKRAEPPAPIDAHGVPQLHKGQE